MTLHPVPKPIPARKRLPKGPKAKGGSAFPKLRDREYRRWVRQENPCLLRGAFLLESVSPRDTEWGESFRHVCWGPRDPAHVGKTVARGAPDFGAVVCLCRAAHRFYDEHRSQWQRVTGMSEHDMESLASGFALRYVERGGKPVRCGPLEPTKESHP